MQSHELFEAVLFVRLAPRLHKIQSSDPVPLHVRQFGWHSVHELPLAQPFVQDASQSTQPVLSYYPCGQSSGVILVPFNRSILVVSKVFDILYQASPLFM